jgi:hypothetical protein
MSNENNKNQQNIEQENIINKNLLKKFFIIILFLGIILFVLTSCISRNGKFEVLRNRKFKVLKNAYEMAAVPLNILTSCISQNGKFEVLRNAYGMAAVPLNENEIFLATGHSGKKLLPAQIYNIKERKFKFLNSFINIERYLENAINLDDGRILIFGGIGNDGSHLKSAEIYNISTNTFERINDTNFPHNSSFTRFVKLIDGRVFIILKSQAEIFDPKTNKFSIAGEQIEYYHKPVYDKNGEKKQIRTTNNIYDGKVALALLKDGRVLILGPNYDLNPNNAEIYDPKTNNFENVGSQHFPMFFRDAVTLKDGRVLVTGGTKQFYKSSANSDVKRHGAIWSAGKEIQDNNAEIFDPNTNKFTIISPLKIVRRNHKSILLSNGKVLIVHGTNDLFLKAKDTKKAEIFNPKTNKFELTSSSDIEWYFFNAIPLNDHTILLTSFYSWEIYKY